MQSQKPTIININMHHIFNQSSKNAKDDDDDARRQDEEIIKLMICFDKQIDVIKKQSSMITYSTSTLHPKQQRAIF
jgi:hypothetical protein